MGSLSRAGSAPSGNKEAAIEDAVRRMVARELHDRVAQTLTGMLVDVENFKTQQVGWADVLRELDSIQSSTRTVLQNLRQLLHDLRGEDAVFGGGFVNALESLVSRFTQSTSIAASLDIRAEWPAPISPVASLNVYRIVEEALANVRFHSGASGAWVVLDVSGDDDLVLVIEDDGRGVETHASRPMGLGTVGMKERALLLGGSLRIESEPARGTRVIATFPTSRLAPAERAANKEEFLVTRSVTA